MSAGVTVQYQRIEQAKPKAARPSARAKVANARAALSRAYASNPDNVGRFEARMAALAAVRRREPKPAPDPEKRWCILRTARSTTVELADALTEAGYEAWTPVEVVTRRATRTRQRVDIMSPIMPTFVFADSAFAVDLIGIAARLASELPDFSVFRGLDRSGTVTDVALSRLRQFEEDVAIRRAMQRPRRRGEPFNHGEEIRMAGGAFGGLVGVIDKSDDRTTYVLFENLRVKMDTSQLREDVI